MLIYNTADAIMKLKITGIYFAMKSYYNRRR